MQETIETVENFVIFQFTEKTLYGRFINEHHDGILISIADTYQTNLPRWAKATHVGSRCTVVKPGDYILIEPGKWTTGFTVNDQRFWKTDESVIILVSDEPGTTY